MPMRDWRPFEAAREFARSLRLLGQQEWMAYARGDMKRLKGLRPRDIPSMPSSAYRGDGWKGIRDWLGPAPVRPAEPGYLDFRRARTFARSLGLASALQWKAWCAGRRPDRLPRPRNVPEDPPAMYPDAWRGWNDWLGAVSVAPVGRFRGFLAAREFARSLGLADVGEWRAFCVGRRPELGSLPDDIPATPDILYCFRGFTGYGDWLGTGVLSCQRRPIFTYEDVRAFVVSLGITSKPQFQAWVSGRRPDLTPRPIGIPALPEQMFAGRGWTSWGDFLGTGRVQWGAGPRRSFPEARKFARSLGLESHQAWRAWCTGRRPALPPKPEDIPAVPDRSYRGAGWTDWGDFLGTGHVAPGSREMLPFEEAREFVRRLRFGGHAEYWAYVKGDRPDLPAPPGDIPFNPNTFYAGVGWKGWTDFLDAEARPARRRKFRTYAAAREYARTLGIPSHVQWRRWTEGRRPDLPRRPADIPRYPDRFYRGEGFTNWADFLGIAGPPGLDAHGDPPPA